MVGWALFEEPPMTEHVTDTGNGGPLRGLHHGHGSRWETIHCKKTFGVVALALLLAACSGSDPNARACDELKGARDRYVSTESRLIAGDESGTLTQGQVDDYILMRGVMRSSITEALMIEEIDPDFQSALEMLQEAFAVKVPKPDDKDYVAAMALGGMTVKEYCGFDFDSNE